MDASGIASINNKNSTWTRLPCPGYWFIQDKYASKLIRAASFSNTITICHTRSATSGVDEGVNGAHPFSMEEGDRELIGVHNGSLQFWSHKTNANKFKVDSEWALNHIFANGIEAFRDFNGAYVFVWWDSADGETLNIALNNERPMHVAFTKEDGMVFCSEAGMLYWLAERHGLGLDGEVIQLTGGNWYKFNQLKLKEFTKTAIPTVATTITRSAKSGRFQQSETHMEKTKNFFDGLKTKALIPLPKKKIVISDVERKAAKDLSILGATGMFIPMWADDDSGELIGDVELTKDVKYTAVIRDGADIDFGPNSSFRITVLGIEEQSKDLVAVCSRPWVGATTAVN